MNRKSMYCFDCMIFNPAGGCQWKFEHENYNLLIRTVLEHLTGKKKMIIKDHNYEDTPVIRKKISSAIIIK